MDTSFQNCRFRRIVFLAECICFRRDKKMPFCNNRGQGEYPLASSFTDILPRGKMTSKCGCVMTHPMLGIFLANRFRFAGSDRHRAVSLWTHNAVSGVCFYAFVLWGYKEKLPQYGRTSSTGIVSSFGVFINWRPPFCQFTLLNNGMIPVISRDCDVTQKVRHYASQSFMKKFLSTCDDTHKHILASIGNERNRFFMGGLNYLWLYWHTCWQLWCLHRDSWQFL